MNGSAPFLTVQLHWPWGGLVFVVGAFAGRALGILVQQLAQGAGYPSSHYYPLEARGRRSALVPVIGHLLLPRGSRSRRALSLELLTGALFVACWLVFPPAKAVCGCIFVLGLIGATFIDLDHMIIPDLFTIGLAVIGVLLSLLVPALHQGGPLALANCARSAATALMGAALGSALVFWLGLLGELILRKEVLGFGDVKFLGAIGAFCGWQGALFSIFGGAAVGAIALVIASIHGRLVPNRSAQLFRLESADGQSARVGWGVHFPFGPMLATAAGLYFFALHPWVDRYLARYLALF